MIGEKIISDDVVRSIIKAELVRLHKGENYSITFNSDGSATCEKIIEQPAKKVVNENEKKKQLLLTKISDFDLSTRAINCLKAGEVEMLAQLVTFPKSDLIKFRQLGKVTANELEELVISKGFTLGIHREELKEKYGVI